MEKKESVLHRYFEFDKHQTNLRTEIIAGITTYFTLAYILLVNPSILKEAGMDLGAVFVATVLSAVIGTLLMALFANYPIALAPGMGLNAYFAYTVVGTMGIDWRVALGAVFISGIIFLILTLTKLREMLINVIPKDLKHAVSAGIGLFIAFIGLKNAKILVPSEATILGINPKFTSDPMILLTLFGLIVTVILMVRKIKGAIFIGILVTAVVGMIFGLIPVPKQIFATPPSIAPTFMQMDIAGALELGAFVVIFSFLFVDLFDGMGTLVGVTTQAGLMKDNKLPRANRALFADSIATMTGATLGTSTVTSYIESSAGVAAGGRTGVTAIVTAIFLGLSLFFFPLVETFAGVAALTSPALIIVGVLMANSLREIEWKRLSDGVPAFITIIMMPLTSSIATGISMGFILYPICKIADGEWKKVHPIMYALGIIFILRYIFLDPV